MRLFERKPVPAESLDTLLRETPDAGEAAIRDVLGGHLCRCTGYEPIVAAALEVSGRARDGEGDA